MHLAAAKGFLVLLCPAYLGAAGGDEGWYAEMEKNGEQKLRAYGEFVGTRFRNLDNLIWLEGGDFTPPARNLGLVNAVAEGIQHASPRQLHAAHWSPETSGADVKAGNWLDLNTTYTYEPVYLKSIMDHSQDDTHPHFLVESRYEEERGSSPQSLRAQAYYALLTGAMGQFFGNRSVWQFMSPSPWRQLRKRTWISALDSAGARSMSYVSKLFASVAWYTLVPDEFYEVLVGGQEMKGTQDYATLAWSRDGRLAIAYVPTNRSITIDLGRFVDPIQARWYDPTNGRFVDELGTLSSTQHDRSFHTPGRNSAGDTDWLLILQNVIVPSR